MDFPRFPHQTKVHCNQYLRDHWNYLKKFGEIGSKAFSSHHDIELFESIRKLSILKESPSTKKDIIQKAEDEVLKLQSKQHELSEMSKIRNLHWWTVEYGLIGPLNNPKIYGAGLLSSISESANCLKSNVKKTDLQMLLRGKNLVGYKKYDDSVIDLFIKKS